MIEYIVDLDNAEEYASTKYPVIVYWARKEEYPIELLHIQEFTTPDGKVWRIGDKFLNQTITSFGKLLWDDPDTGMVEGSVVGWIEKTNGYADLR